MSGKKQHYIPQSILKGFRISQNGKIARVWVFKKDEEPRTASTRDVAAQRYFYSELSKGDSFTLDDAITEYENAFSDKVRLLRDTAIESPCDAELASEINVSLTPLHQMQ